MAITKRLVKGSALSHTELDGNFTHLAGDGTYQAPSTKGTTKQVLRMNSGATALEFATVSTADITEDSSNQFYTDAKVNTRISAVVTKSFVDGLYTSTAPQNSFEIKTASFNTSNAKRYMVDTTGGVVTATLPATPSAGNTIEFTNGAQNFATNNLIIARNGSTIDGSASDLTVSANPTGGMLSLIYDGTTWRSR